MSEAMAEARRAAVVGFHEAVSLLIADDTIGEIEAHAAIDAYEAALESAGLVLVPLMPTPEQITAAQMKSELGAYACENWAEAYSTIIELYRAMIAAADPR